MLILVVLLAACSDGIPKPVENDDGSVSWNGWTLTRFEEPSPYPVYNQYGVITAQPNVLTTKQITFALTIESRYKDKYEFGTDVQIQVLLNGRWYSLPYEPSASDKPLLLPPMDREDKNQTSVEYDVDLSAAGNLPPGA